MSPGEKNVILIVEDDAEMHLVYKSLFEGKKDKYEVQIVSDARIAFSKVSKNTVDLIILDIIMEPMDGESFFACMRNDEKIGQIPVLVVSVLHPSDLEAMKKLGNIDFIQKPIIEEQLFRKIEKLLG